MGFILDFLFGKSPKIFDQEGQVRHKLSDERWKKWDGRYRYGADFNWRNHTGTRSPKWTQPQEEKRDKTQA